MSIPQIIWKVRPNGFLHHKFVLTHVDQKGWMRYRSACSGIVLREVTVLPGWEVRTDAPGFREVDWCPKCGPKRVRDDS